MAFLQVSTTNPLGQRPLNFMMKHQGPPVYAGLLGWIGAAATPGDYDTNTQVLGALVSMGAISPDESAQIDAGTLSLDDLPVTMTMINEALSETGQTGAQTVLPLPSSVGAPLTTLPPSPSSGGVQIVPYTPIVPAAAAAAAPQVSPGSTLLYTASYAVLKSWTSGAAAISALAPLLPGHGMSLLTQQVSSSGLWTPTASFSITVLDSVGNALVSDAKSILDSLMNQITNNGLQSSSLTVVSQGTTAAGIPQPPGATGITAWIEQNAVWLAVLALAAVTLPGIVRRL